MQESKDSSFFFKALPFFVVAHFAHHLLTALPTPLLPFIRSDLNLDYTQSALVISAFIFSYGIGQLPAGWLADRIGQRVLMTIGFSGVAVAGLLVGLSKTYTMMLVCLVLMGLAGGGYHPAATPLISASVDPKKRGRALGIHLIGGSGSFFLSPIIAAAIAVAWGWRGSFIGLAIPTAVFGVIFYIFLGRWGGSSHEQPAKTDDRDEASSIRDRIRLLVAFMVLSVLSGGMFYSSISFLPLYIVDHFGISKRTAASLLAFIYSAGLWAGPLGGYLSDHLGRVKLMLATCLISGSTVYLLNHVPYGPGLFVLLLIMGMSMFMRLVVSEAFIIGHTSSRHRSTVYGIFYFSSQESGAVFAPILGIVIDQFGFNYGFTIASVFIIILTLVCAPLLRGSQD
jgi:MFS family permease